MPSSKNDVKIERIKLWQVTLGLITALITLAIAVFAFMHDRSSPSPEDPTPKTETTTPADDKASQRSNPDKQSLTEADKHRADHKPKETAPEIAISHTSDDFDTLKVFIPSKLQLQEARVDDTPARILKQTPSVAWLRFPHHEGNRQLLLIGTEQQCRIQKYFKGNETIAVTLSDCQ